MADLYEQRRGDLAAVLGHDNIDAALVTNVINVRYLTGLDSSNAALLVWSSADAQLATDGRYATAAAATAPGLELIIDRNVAATLARRAADQNRTLRLGIEEHHFTLASWATVEAAIDGTGAEADVVHLGRAVEKLRMIKDDDELELVAQACSISCRALEDLYAAGGLLGRAEREIARDLEWRMFGYGADGLAFDTIVASGPNSAIPHHRVGDRVVARGDLLKIDFGAVYRGYRADCTRTVLLGAQPTGWQREIYDIVAAAQAAGRTAAIAGEDCVAVDRASRVIIDEAGYKEHFGHGTGHGIGLEAHEAPTIGYSSPGTLADRMTVTVEPGIYLPGRGGVRIEDTLAVRAVGGPDVLTPTTRDLLVLDA